MSIDWMRRREIRGQLWDLNNRLDKLYKSPVDNDDRDDQFCALLEIVRSLADVVDSAVECLEDDNYDPSYC